jgi:hypothetical protein
MSFVEHGGARELRGSLSLAGRGSELHKKHGIYLDIVTVASHPDAYGSRVREVFLKSFRHLRLYGMDAHDLVLTKLPRNSDRDRADVEYLANAVPLDVTVLRKRYDEEMRPHVAIPEREDMTLGLWIEIIEELQQRTKR